MSARELDRFRRAQDRFESQQEQDVSGMAEERREREAEEEAREAGRQSSGERRLRRAADRRDREIAESARQREEGLEASDRQLREAADRQEVGGDGLLRAEARRQRQEAEEQRELFDRELDQEADEAMQNLRDADRELFQAAERQEQQFQQERFERGIEAELDRRERLRDLRPRAEPETEMQQRIERGVGEAPSIERFERGVGDIGQSLARASSAIRGEFRDAPPDIANIGDVIATGAEPEFIEPGGFRTGAVQSAGAIADVPGTALGLAAIGRFAGERGAELATGRADEAVAETTRAFESGIEAGREAVTERPVQTLTTIGGSLLLSAGAFGAASAVGSRTGTAARFAIQPGEEILGRGGFAATRAVRGEAAAQRLFPNREPVIFSEEAVIRRTQQAADTIRDLEVRRTDRIGAGIVPPIEVRRTRTEPELEDAGDEVGIADAADIEMQRRLLEAEQRSVVPRRDQPFRSDLTPEGTFFEPRGLDPRTRQRLRVAQEQELAQQTELELGQIRTELELFDQLEQATTQGITERVEETELIDEMTEAETTREQPPFETELPPLETEQPPIETERPPAETEFPPIETELPPREIETQTFPLEADEDEEEEPFGPDIFEGVRVVEAELEPREL